LIKLSTQNNVFIKIFLWKTKPSTFFHVCHGHVPLAHERLAAG
jgi:hypothetical protein